MVRKSGIGEMTESFFSEGKIIDFMRIRLKVIKTRRMEKNSVFLIKINSTVNKIG
jgi:hypothetical protein